MASKSSGSDEGKGRGKGKSFPGYRKENNKEETTMTNNSQSIFLEEPTKVGSNDEATIVLTQNMNKIMLSDVKGTPSLILLIALFFRHQIHHLDLSFFYLLSETGGDGGP
jgi:hypothetical protein